MYTRQLCFSYPFKISNNAVDENSGENTIVGTFTTTDDDVSQRYTYNLVQSADGRFKIERNILKVVLQ